MVAPVSGTVQTTLLLAQFGLDELSLPVLLTIGTAFSVPCPDVSTSQEFVESTCIANAGSESIASEELPKVKLPLEIV